MSTRSKTWNRRTLGVAVIAGVAAIGYEVNLKPPAAWMLTASAAEPQPVDEGGLPGLGGAIAWFNSAPLSDKSLRGKVVLVNFWTYSCINSLRELPYMKAWAAKYKDAGLVVIGVHTPEFSFEKEAPNVKQALLDLHVTYPVAVDSDYAIWQAFHND